MSSPQQPSTWSKEENVWRLHSYLDSVGLCQHCSKACGSPMGACPGEKNQSFVKILSLFVTPTKPATSKGQTTATVGCPTLLPAGCPANQAATVPGILDKWIAPTLDQASISAMEDVDEELRLAIQEGICSDELLSLGVEPVSKLLSMDKQSAIFLYIVGQNGTNRQTQDRFQHSGKTISRVFHHIIYLFLQLQKKYIVTPPVNIAHESILENQKFSPFFDRCIGAMDGCHVPAFVPEHMAGPYRNRKGMLSQNVLGVVDFNMKFTYMMVGWEGSAHNSRVLGSAMSEDFSIPNSSCYLADAGYSLGKEHKGHSQYFEDPDYDGGAPDNEEIPDNEDNGTDELALSQAQARAAQKLWRDTLAQDMWDQYTSYLQQRNQG
ncbi:hypothetical protein MJO28_006270 [Puccinia striiformis f. sp. tritici]|uniref:Uncharacterized protein n=1 Tax=Puccinia striiformis f. sp. tritici TaxID=168172 RepID=A0ACC0EGZ1_9BASI|nr:hypothetical protein MJO28_006270 [Puccinia striiformis f. sp. tritici]